MCYTPDREINPPSFFEREEDVKETFQCKLCGEDVEEDPEREGSVCDWCLKNKEPY